MHILSVDVLCFMWTLVSSIMCYFFGDGLTIYVFECYSQILFCILSTCISSGEGLGCHTQ